jgi:ankyrin repeat protein
VQGEESLLQSCGLLIAACPDVAACRSADGVCTVWLAAQFGHVHYIKALVNLNADPNQAAKNGATPAYAATQVGNVDCVEELARLNADLCYKDNDGLTASHQAAMNGHCDIILLLKNQEEEHPS